MLVRDTIYVDGAWVPPAGGAKTLLDVTDSATEEVIARVVACGAEDVDRAVKAARRAQEAWAARSIEERASLLEKLQAGLGARMQDIARAISAEVGMPLRQSMQIQAGYPAMLAGIAAA